MAEGYIPTCLKHLLITLHLTLFLAFTMHRTAIRRFTDFTISAGGVFSVNLTNDMAQQLPFGVDLPPFDYTCIQGLHDVVFFGKKATLMLENVSVNKGEWHGTLSKKRIICLSCLFRRSFNLVLIVTIISVLNHVVSLLEYWALQGYGGFAEHAKQRSHLLLPITVRASVSPTAFTKNAAVIRCFAFLLPLQRFPF